MLFRSVCSPMSIQARGGYEYFITFTNDYSKFDYVYLMKRKSEIFEKFKEFRAEVENQLGKRIKVIRSNRGGTWNSTTNWCSRKKEYDSFRYG